MILKFLRAMLTTLLTAGYITLLMQRLGDRALFSGYNVMLGLREDNIDIMPQTARIRVGRIRTKDDGKR